MELSSGVLLHQTDYDGLRVILRSGTFLVSYSLEDIFCLDGDHTEITNNARCKPSVIC